MITGREKGRESSMHAVKQFFINYKNNWEKGYIMGYLLFLLGGGMIETAILDFGELGWKTALIMIGFGLLMAAPGVIITGYSIIGAIPTKEEMRVEEEKRKKPEKESRFTKSLREFRETLNAFFENPRQVTNDPIQEYVTQVYFQILSLQKRRLASRGITLNIHAEQKQYTSGNGYIPAIQEKSYDDGKYKIAMIKEQISGVKRFLSGDKEIYRVKEEEMANYTLLKAFQRGADDVVCPSCGNTTTRENLLDGCDYCRTKFMVEDLGEKVQDFSFQSNYEVEYAKYQKARSWMWRWSFLLGGIPGAVFMMAVGVKTYFEMWAQGQRIGPFVAILGGIIASLTFALISTVIISVFIWFVFFPIVQTVASIRYVGKKQVQTAKEKAERDAEVERTVRSFDGRFSLQGFYGGVENKLAGIHFAENPKEINAFTTFDLSGMLSAYQNVIDVEVDFMRLDHYAVQNGLQYACVLTTLHLLSSEGNKVRKRVEKIRLEMIKSADCITQAVTGPEVIRCKGCGASLLLLEGKHCQYCGSHIPLFEHDWVITNYQVQMK